MTPRLTPHSGSEALRFVCFSCIASRVSRFFLKKPGAKVFAGHFSEGVFSLAFQTEAVFLQSSANIFAKSEGGATTQPFRPRTQASQTNSRNLLIIARDLHIVNHSAAHHREKQVLGLRP